MKSLDLKSTLIAGAVGAATLWLLMIISEQQGLQLGMLPLGFVVGAGTQIGVRLLGVS